MSEEKEFTRGYIAGFQTAIWRLTEAHRQMEIELIKMRRDVQVENRPDGEKR